MLENSGIVTGALSIRHRARIFTTIEATIATKNTERVVIRVMPGSRGG